MDEIKMKASTLKKEARKKKEALLYELKYKKIKFFERKKVLKMMKKSEDHSYLQDCLTYIDNFPKDWKYVSLFPKEDTEISKEARKSKMAIIKKMVLDKQNIRKLELKKDEDGGEDIDDRIVAKK